MHLVSPKAGIKNGNVMDSVHPILLTSLSLFHTFEVLCLFLNKNLRQITRDTGKFLISCLVKTDVH